MEAKDSQPAFFRFNIATKTILFLGAVTVIIVVFCCTEAAVPSTKVGVKIPIITLVELLQLARDTNTIIVDVRDEDSYRYGHIPAALNIPDHTLNNISHLQLLTLIKAPAVVVYCGNAACGTSFFAARKLIDRGVDNVKVYANGWGEWQSCGLLIVATKL